VHALVFNATVAPYRPAGHSVHVPAPPKLYVPTPHTLAVAFVLPAGQEYPAVQLPLQAAVAAPAAPHVPAGHEAVHALELNAAVAPYLPAGQALQEPARAALNLPGVHVTAVAFVLPTGHAYPAMQLPEQAADVRFTAAPKVPAGHNEHTLAPAIL
jgi:hypothetical protein